MSYLSYIPVILLGYLLGSSSMAFYLSHGRGINLREHGSGNYGASNTMAVLGWKSAVLVGAHDIGKGILAVVLARLIAPTLPYAGAAAGAAAVLGHIFPFYMRFRGGKGLASYLGVTIALNWKLAAGVVLLLIVITLVTDYIVYGTLSTIISVPVYFAAAEKNYIAALLLLTATVVMLFKHTDNYKRLLAGNEIGFRHANRGDFRK